MNAPKDYPEAETAGQIVMAKSDVVKWLSLTLTALMLSAGIVTSWADIKSELKVNNGKTEDNQKAVLQLNELLDLKIENLRKSLMAESAKHDSREDELGKAMTKLDKSLALIEDRMRRQSVSEDQLRGLIRDLIKSQE